MKRFLEEIRRALKNEISDSEIDKTVEYYRNYIENERMSGKSDDEIFDELGDPILIARSIIDANNISGMSQNYNSKINTNSSYENTNNEYKYNDRYDSYYRKFKLYGCLIPLLFIVLIVALIVITVNAIVSIIFSLPGIILLCSLFLYYLYKKR